jgi:hypothetical protein
MSNNKKTKTIVAVVPKKATTIQVVNATNPNKKKKNKMPSHGQMLSQMISLTSGDTRAKFIALLLACPELGGTLQPPRYSSSFTLKPTAVFGLQSTITVNSAPGTYAPGIAQLNPNQLAMIVSRDPCKWLQFWDPNTNDYTYSSNIQKTLPVVALGQGPMEPLEFPPLLQLVGNAFGPALFPQRVQYGTGHAYYFVNSGSSITLAANAGVLGTDTMYYQMWESLGDSDDEGLAGAGTINSGSGYQAVINFNKPSWIRFAGNITVSHPNLPLTLTAIYHPSGNPGAWNVRSLPDFYTKCVDFGAMRMPAFSGRLHSSAPVLQNGGSMVAVQLPQGNTIRDISDAAGNDWFTYANTLAEKWDTEDQFKGIFGFAKATQNQDYDLFSPGSLVLADSGLNNDFIYKTPAGLIRSDSDDLLFVWQFQTANLATQPLSCLFQVSCILEVISQKQWYTYGKSDFTPEDWENANKILNGIPQFHKNDLHFSDIWNGIKQGVSDVWDGIKVIAREGPEVASGVSRIGGAFAKFAI